MAKVYYRKIKADAMGIDEVPKRWKTEVLELLEADKQAAAEAQE